MSLQVTSPTLLALTHSWPLWEQSRRFELGHILNSAITDAMEPLTIGDISAHHAGCWECDLTDDSLVWSGGVYDIFGLQRGLPVTRGEAVALYSESSRAAMDRLRTFSIKHKRGFTLDAEIHAANGDSRWMRLIAAPICVDDQVVRLHGIKLAL